MGELYRRLSELAKSDLYPYHMPGHKRQQTGGLPQEWTDCDITEIDGFDNLHAPTELLKKLQCEASELYGSQESFYLVGGSSCGVLAAISTAVPYGGRLLIVRGAHKSAYHAAYLRNLTLSYLYPPVIEEYDIPSAVTAEEVEAALLRESADAVLVVSPTYEGRIADVKGIASIVHAHGIPLIVDEAHGAHLGLAEGFVPNSNACGADLVIHSVHKTLPALTQSALLHVNGSLIDRERLRRFLQIYQSTSPSYLLMAGIDDAMETVREKGTFLFSQFRERYLRMQEELAKCRYLSFLPAGDGQDIGKLVLSFSKAGLSGQRIYDILRTEYHLQLEMAAPKYALAMFTVADTEEGYRRMTEALLDIDRRIASGELRATEDEKSMQSTSCAAEDACNLPEAVLPLTAAWDMPSESVPFSEAIGRLAGGFVNLYPPGTPILVPGERIEGRHIRAFEEHLAEGLNLQGVEKQDVWCIRVLTDACEA